METAGIRKIYIYTLSHPVTSEVKYVGKSVNPSNRYTQHIIDAKNNKSKSYKSNWIRSLLSNNLQPEIHIIDELEDNNWKWLEEYWIAQMRTWGFKLTNMTDGGDGNNNQIATLESRIKRSIILKGRKRPEEIRLKISRSNTGKVVSEATKMKLRKNNLGKVASEKSKELKRKKVYCYADGKLVITFNSVLEASQYFNSSKGQISNAIRRNTKKFRSKYILSYKDIVGQ